MGHRITRIITAAAGVSALAVAMSSTATANGSESEGQEPAVNIEAPNPAAEAPSLIDGAVITEAGEQRIPIGEATFAPADAVTTDEDGEFVVNDGGSTPLGTCTWWWTLDWQDTADYALDLDYGLSADCNFPDVGWSAYDTGTQARLYTADGSLEAEAEEGHGGFWGPSESLGTTPVSWPSSWYHGGWVEMLLYPGCDPTGCGDPKQQWLWLEAPPECDGIGTPLLWCLPVTDVWDIGNTPCGTGNTFTEAAGSMYAALTCNDSGNTITGSVSDTANDGKCAYAIVVLEGGGSYLWEGTCDGGDQKTFSWPTSSDIVHAYLWFQ